MSPSGVVFGVDICGYHFGSVRFHMDGNRPGCKIQNGIYLLDTVKNISPWIFLDPSVGRSEEETSIDVASLIQEEGFLLGVARLGAARLGVTLEDPYLSSNSTPGNLYPEELSEVPGKRWKMSPKKY